MDVLKEKNVELGEELEKLREENKELERGFKLLVFQNECLICFGTPRFCKGCYMFKCVGCYENDIISEKDKDWEICEACEELVCDSCGIEGYICEGCDVWACSDCDISAKCGACDKTLGGCIECIGSDECDTKVELCDECEQWVCPGCINGTECTKCEKVEV